MPLARACVPYLFWSIGAAIVCFAAWRKLGHPVFVWAAAFAAVLAVCLAWFFRDPERKARAGGNDVISPADGIVRRVSIQGGRKVVEIFMRVWDVHVQRAPVSGRVLSRKYTKGSYIPADDRKAGTLNTRCLTRIRSRRGPVDVLQVAGLIARRVECWLKPGQDVARGGRMGIIHLGSQVRVIMPASAKITVSRGQKIAAGVSIIAKWRPL